LHFEFASDFDIRISSLGVVNRRIIQLVSPQFLGPRIVRGSVLLAATLALAGCEPPAHGFRLNVVRARKYELDAGEHYTPEQFSDIHDAVTRLFGTPDKPQLPAEETLAQVLDQRLLERAAGPPGSEKNGTERGLYRRHCAHCHGITGDGAGPAAAWMNPYPRDFRPGVFALKSTPIGHRPTDDDLQRVIRSGISGTSMPAFGLLDAGDIRALAEYVKYLAIRGEVEIMLIDESSDLDPADGERLDTSHEFLIEEIVAERAAMWSSADRMTAVPARPQWDLAESVRKGRELYLGEVANCVKCHGKTGLGDGQEDYFDYWTEQLEPARPERLRQYLALGALPPRNILPHNLRSGIYRGGRRPVDIYRRIHNGIEGTPMPVASMKPDGAGPDAVGLTPDDIWHLVDYVRSLPFEPAGVTSHRDTTESKLPPVAQGGAGKALAKITGRQFQWQVQYPGTDGTLDTRDDVFAVNELHAPVGRAVALVIEDVDVRHGFALAGIPLQQDAGQGRGRVVVFKADTIGTHDIVRTEPCAWGHHRIKGRLTIETPEQFRRYLKQLHKQQTVSQFTPRG